MDKPLLLSTPEESLPVTLLEVNNSRAIPVPTLYTIRFFCGEIEIALETLLQNQELQEILSEKEGEKDEIHRCLQRIMQRFQEYLMIDARR